MDGAKQFIDEARAKGMDDDKIRDLLTGNGWSAGQVDSALNGLTVPPAPGLPVPPPPAVSANTAPARPSISALEAALQHILLWLFTGMSSIMIGVVSAALFGATDGSSNALLTYVVLELVTFAPFCGLFIYYLKQQKNRPEITTGKVWSIITIVLHSLGLVGSIIALVLFIVLVRDDASVAGVAASIAIGIMNALVVSAYVLANVVKASPSKLRHRLLQAFPVALFVLISIFGVLALMRVGPLKADDQTRQNLVDVTKSVHDYATTNNKLPASSTDIAVTKEGVTYKMQSTYIYQLCAEFNRVGKGYYPNYRASTISDDSYIGTYDFSNGNKGENCWTIHNMTLENSSNPAYCLNYSVDYCKTTPVIN